MFCKEDHPCQGCGAINLETGYFSWLKSHQSPTAATTANVVACIQSNHPNAVSILTHAIVLYAHESKYTRLNTRIQTYRKQTYPFDKDKAIRQTWRYNHTNQRVLIQDHSINVIQKKRNKTKIEDRLRDEKNNNEDAMIGI